MNLEQVEKEIYETYQWFHREAPHVRPAEAGRLALLWRAFESLVSER